MKSFVLNKVNQLRSETLRNINRNLLVSFNDVPCVFCHGNEKTSDVKDVLTLIPLSLLDIWDESNIVSFLETHDVEVRPYWSRKKLISNFGSQELRLEFRGEDEKEVFKVS
jgi:hypothetical protein